MKGEFVYANGMTLGLARRLYRFYFGEFFLKAEKNEKEWRFDVYIRDKFVDKERRVFNLNEEVDVEYFNEFWNQSIQNPAWKILIVSIPLK